MELENKNNITQLSLQAKREFISKFCILAKIKNNVSNNPNLSFIDIFLKALDNDGKKIFTEEFINNNTNSNWYLNYYSKNFYYKKLNFLVNLFIGFINDIKSFKL
ncbi:MG284/MPN403 family protein [Metamycoplasma equirhinis]|uniref:Uncharacterized protein n=1 Tax=Metamycoplasma equirhinis TaxID=92402 RepID=A0ABZ0P9Y4_9BACT|nr:hypothetical protein [Metamycoplasma equirhinis]TPD98744.1 hypothetical protein FJM08_01625 [Metamycoplasma equirhinis]WPB53720.1 hypothetical protein R9B83_01875 [Metamycoplasma equirhinis]